MHSTRASCAASLTKIKTEPTLPDELWEALAECVARLMNGEPLGRECEQVWDDHADELYEE